MMHLYVRHLHSIRYKFAKAKANTNIHPILRGHAIGGGGGPGIVLEGSYNNSDVNKMILQ